MAETAEHDARFVAAAIRLGARALGTTWPNPAVGAIVVRDGIVMGRGRTGPGGRPHGERLALEAAGPAARGATLYVSLEPCAHHGRTPPCTDAIIGAGVARVVATLTDADPRVGGRGFVALREAGIELAPALCGAAARAAHGGHLMRAVAGRPQVTLKLAISADGAIGRVGERAVPVTGETARRHVQALRARFDAILVGRGTIAADDPLLTCRLPGLEWRSPVRVVLDSAGRIDGQARILDPDSPVPTWIVSAVEDRRGLAREGRVRWLKVARDGEGVSPAAALAALGAAGVTRILVEGGARVARSFLAAGLVDEALLFRSPVEMGEGSVPALAGLDLAAIEASPRFKRVARRSFGPDRLTRYVRVP